MWLSGNKTEPTFTYTLSEKRGKAGLTDEVHYKKNGRAKVIKGFDYPDATNERAFIWRGNGLLAIAKSKWEVKLIDTTQGWAVIHFSKTLFTPEGVDVISRKKELDAATLNYIKAAMLKDEVLKKHVQELVELH